MNMSNDYNSPENRRRRRQREEARKAAEQARFRVAMERYKTEVEEALINLDFKESLVFTEKDRLEKNREVMCNNSSRKQITMGCLVEWDKWFF
jgi:hypothetical protein